jgi:hypothetical protein
MIEFEITELNRRLANLIVLGKVVEADYTLTTPKLWPGVIKQPQHGGLN